MAKETRIVAGKIQDTTYYYASDGSVVDENGKPAPAKFAAMFPPKPEQKPEKPIKETKPKKTRRRLKDLAGKIGNSKYYYDKDGNVVDEEGKPVSEKLLGYFGKREEIRKALPKVEPKKQTNMIDGRKLRVINSEVSKAIRSTQNLVQSNEIIQDKMTTMFDSFNDVVKTLGEQNDAIVQRLIQQNQDFQDKVIETMIGVPSPTKAGGAKPRKINPRAVGGSRAARGTELKVKETKYRETRRQEVEERARRIAAIKTKRDVQAIVVGSLLGATAGVGAGAIISAITPSTAAPPTTPTPPGGAPGGTTPSAPGGTGDTTPGTGGMTRLKTKSGKAYEVDSKFAANFKGFVDELEAAGYQIKSIGGYSPRPGWHGKGMAIDINPDDNPMLINSGGRIINKLTGRESGDLKNSKYPFGYGKDNFGSIDVASMARKWGLGWGGNWRSSSDTMHFSAGANEGGTGAMPEGSPQVAVNGSTPGSPTGGIAPMSAPAAPATGTGGVGSIQAPGGQVTAGTAGAGAAPGSIAKINEVGPGYNVVQLADGSVERRAGARNWRNNNPGNIEYGGFAKSAGAIGSDGRFAIFPSYEIGRAAKEKLLFEGRSYSGMSIQQAIYKYAPPSENNSAAYAANVAAAAGVSPSTGLAALTPEQRKAMLNAMERVEGFRSGKITKVSEGNTQVVSADTPPKAYAAGDPYVPNTGPAIVGERGPELVVGKDGSSRLTGDGAHVENLNKGDSVVPADKTKKLMGYAEGTSNSKDFEFLNYNPLGGFVNDKKIDESLVQFRRRAHGQRMSESAAEDRKGFERIQKGASGEDYGAHNRTFYYEKDIPGLNGLTRNSVTATGYYNPITDKHYSPESGIKQSQRSSPEAIKSKLEMWNINANAMSEQNAMQEYTQPPAVKPIIINNNTTNNVTKTVYQDSSLPTIDRDSDSRGKNNRTPTGAF